MIKRYSSIFNCNQNYHKYKKYQVWLQRLDIQTNNISISIYLGFQNFSENSSKILYFIKPIYIN